MHPPEVLMLEPVAVASSDLPVALPSFMPPYGGAQSFAAAEAFTTAAEAGSAVEYEMGTFEILLGNIRQSGLSASEKIDAITALVAELRARVDGDAVDAGDPGTMMVFKDNSNEYRWFAVHSNRYEDRQRETFSEQSHKAWVDRVWQKSEFPALRLWHIPMDIGRADWVDYDDRGFVLSSGKFNPGMEDAAERLSKMKGLGCSHGYLYRGEDLRNGVYSAYRSYEVSVLPARRVANDLTAFFATEEVPMLTPERRAFIAAVMGEDRVKAMEDGVGTLASLARERGLSYKSLEEALLDDVAAEAEALVGERAFPPPKAQDNTPPPSDAANATGDQQQKCPQCDAMVKASDMVTHMTDVHGQAPADAGVAAPEAVATAPAAAADAQQAVTLPTPATSPPLAAAPAAPALTPGAVLEGVGEILKGVGTMLDGGGAGAGVNSPTDPGAAQAAAFVEANKAEPEPEEDVLVTAFKSAVTPMFETLNARMADMDARIHVLQGTKDAEIADAIRPRVGPDVRAGAAASASPETVIDAAAARRIVEANGGGEKSDDMPVTLQAAQPYISDLKNVMRNHVGVPTS